MGSPSREAAGGRRRLGLLVAIVLVFTAALLVRALTNPAGEAPAAGALLVEGAVVRPASAGLESAAYMTLRNASREAVLITGVEADFAGRAEMHRTVVETTTDAAGRPSQIVRMQPVEAYAIPAGQSLRLEPGGPHIMLIGLKRDLRAGEQVQITLRTASGEAIAVTATVGEPAATGGTSLGTNSGSTPGTAPDSASGHSH